MPEAQHGHSRSGVGGGGASMDRGTRLRSSLLHWWVKVKRRAKHKGRQYPRTVSFSPSTQQQETGLGSIAHRQDHTSVAKQWRTSHNRADGSKSEKRGSASLLPARYRQRFFIQQRVRGLDVDRGRGGAV